MPKLAIKCYSGSHGSRCLVGELWWNGSPSCILQKFCIPAFFFSWKVAVNQGLLKGDMQW